MFVGFLARWRAFAVTLMRAEIRKVNLGPDDVFLVKLDRLIDDVEAAHLRGIFQDALPAHRVLLIGPPIGEIAVLTGMQADHG